MTRNYSLLFKMGGIWNMVIGLWFIVGYLFAPDLLTLVNTSPVADGFYFILTSAAVFLFGIGYYITGVNYQLGKLMALLGTAVKLTLPFLVAYFYSIGDVASGWIAITAGDVVWALLFIICIKNIETGKVPVN